MSKTIAALDVHKKVLMVVILAQKDEVDVVARRRFLTGTKERQQLVDWLKNQNVDEVVMESTAQYWRPIWLDLEARYEEDKLHLAQAYSNRAPKGRKHDFKDAERLGRRLLSGELILSFVPDPEQRAWRMLSRTRVQLTEDHTRLQNQIEALLEEMRIKLSSIVSDLVGVSGFRILRAIANGVKDASKLAALGDAGLKCSEEELADAVNVPVSELHRGILKLMLDRMELIRTQKEEIDLLLAAEMKAKESAVKRLSEVPGLGPQSAMQIIAEVGAEVKKFASAGEFASWIGTCPGSEESAEQNKSAVSPKGNRFMRRILMQAAMAAVKTKGSIFEVKFRQLLPKGYKQAAWAIAHKLSRVIWKLLHDGVDYIELGPSRNEKAKQGRIKRMCKELRRLGYAIQTPQTATA